MDVKFYWLDKMTKIRGETAKIIKYAIERLFLLTNVIENIRKCELLLAIESAPVVDHSVVRLVAGDPSRRLVSCQIPMSYV